MRGQIASQGEGKRNLNKAFLIIRIEVHSPNGQYVDCHAGKLAILAILNLRLLTYTHQREESFEDEEFTTVTAYVVLKCAFFVSYFIDLSAAFGAIGHFLLPEAFLL